MKIRFFAALAILLLVVACAPEAATDTEPATEPEAGAEAEPAMPQAEAAVDAVRADYVRHYNAGDAEAVASLFAEDAVTLFAGGGVNEGRDAIAASLEEALAAGPTVQIDSLGSMVMGDFAVDHGHYEAVTSLPDGESVSFGGNYMSMLRQVEGEWKLGGVISNHDAEPPAGLPIRSMPAGGPPPAPEDNPLADVLVAYQESFNAGDAAAVAMMYTEDAWAAYAHRAPVEGREAIQAVLEERIAAGSPQLTIHMVGVQELGDGWYGAGGWNQVNVGDEMTGNNWMGLFRTAEDGTIQLHWVVSNMAPVDAG